MRRNFALLLAVGLLAQPTFAQIGWLAGEALAAEGAAAFESSIFRGIWATEARAGFGAILRSEILPGVARSELSGGFSAVLVREAETSFVSRGLASELGSSLVRPAIAAETNFLESRIALGIARSETSAFAPTLATTESAGFAGFLGRAESSAIGKGFIGFEENQSIWTVEARTIRFTQDSAGSFFRDKSPVTGLAEDLRAGRVMATEVEPIRVFEKEGKLFSLDNRRLYAFQEADLPIRVRWATPAELAEELPSKFTTTNDGVGIFLRPLK